MKTVLITGSSEGIGFALAKTFAAKGYRILLNARNKEKLAEAAAFLNETYKAQTVCIPLDLTQDHAAEELFRLCKEYPVDVLINNAGSGFTGVSWQQDIQKEEDMIRLNVIAMMSLSKLFLKEMTERGAGIIINVASTGAFQPGPYIAGYYASKAFVLNYTRAIEREAKKQGVKVYCLCPGPVRTGFYEKGKGHCPSYAMSPEDVAEYMYDHLGKKRCVVVPGMINRIARIFPSALKTRFVERKKEKEIR